MATAADRLTQQLHNTLLQSPHVPRDGVWLENRQGHVVVRGAVDSYYQKQMAQEVLLRVEGVSALENQLEVHWT